MQSLSPNTFGMAIKHQFSSLTLTETFLNVSYNTLFDFSLNVNPFSKAQEFSLKTFFVYLQILILARGFCSVEVLYLYCYMVMFVHGLIGKGFRHVGQGRSSFLQWLLSCCYLKLNFLQVLELVRPENSIFEPNLFYLGSLYFHFVIEIVFIL